MIPETREIPNTPAWFDERFYLTAKQNLLAMNGETYTTGQILQSMAANNMTPYQHYINAGDSEGLSPSPYINQYEYLSAKARQLNTIKFDGKTNWDITLVAEAFEKAGLTAGEHYAAAGWKEQINPSNAFDTSEYLASKLASVRRINGTDNAGKLYSSYELGDIVAVFTANGTDPISHYKGYGISERLTVSQVPENERVPDDPAKPRGPVLAEDGKTITVHLQSPVISESIEGADFTVNVDGVSHKVATVTAGKDKSNYDIILTLDNAARIPGVNAGDADEVRVVYNPNGGDKSQLATEAGPVNPFDHAVENKSLCFDIVERVSQTIDATTNIAIRTLHVTLTPPEGYVPSTDATSYVKINLATTSGVVTGGSNGLITAPRLMDGSQVHNLDTSAVSPLVNLDITARTDGGDIITGEGADSIAFGAGQDTLVFNTKTTSQLSHMDTVKGFKYEAIVVPETPDLPVPPFTGDTIRFADNSITKVVFKGPLSLEGALLEKAIQGVFNGEIMLPDTAYLLQDGKEFLLVADSNGNGLFEADNDFALSLIGITGLPTTLTSGESLNSMIG